MFMKCSKGFVRAVIYIKWLCFSCGGMTHAIRKDGKLEIKGERAVGSLTRAIRPQDAYDDDDGCATLRRDYINES